MHPTNKNVFEFRRFYPRTGLQEEVDRLLEDALSQLPKGAEARAVAVDVGDKYLFSAVVKVHRGLFSSEIAILKQDAHGRHRLWQMEPSAQVLRDVVLQVQRWKDAHQSRPGTSGNA